MARDTFNSDTQHWLKSLIRRHLPHPVPYIYPLVGYAKPLTTHSAANSTTTAADHTDLPCACTHWKTLLLEPAHPTTGGHYILTLDSITLPPHLRIFLDANMNSAFFPTKARYHLTFQTAFRKWLRVQGLPPTLLQYSDVFLNQQWQQHIHLNQQPRFTARLIRQLQEYPRDQVVLRHADHELQLLRIFCPQQYFLGALNTWRAPELFQPMPHLTPLNIAEHLQATVPTGLRARYTWGFRKDFTIPYGIVHLKEKKQWQKAIISCYHSLAGNLLRSTSRALDIILQRLYPQHPGQLSIPRLCGTIFALISTTPQMTLTFMPPTMTL